MAFNWSKKKSKKESLRLQIGLNRVEIINLRKEVIDIVGVVNEILTIIRSQMELLERIKNNGNNKI